MRSKQVPEVIKMAKILEMRNLMKTLVFTTFLKGEDIRNLKMFSSKIIKKHVCGPDVNLGTSNQIKSQKVIQNGLQWETLNPWKIDKIPPWNTRDPV